MTERIVINPDYIYESIRAIIPTLPPSEDVADLHLRLTPMDGQITVTTFDNPRTVANLSRTENTTTVHIYKIKGTGQTND